MTSPAYKSDYLTRCTVYRLTDDEPFFLGCTEEGDIAYYGLILQSRYNEDLKTYLMDSAKDSLWEYQHGFGHTSADSTLVIEGLWASGVDRNYLKKSLRRLVELYYSETGGAFKTVLEGRARYWRGVSVETTAHIAYLLHTIDSAAYPDEIEHCARYILREQRLGGFWTGKWFPSVMIPTYYAVRFLSALGGDYGKALMRADEYIKYSRGEAGGWMGSVIDTAAAVLALDAMKSGTGLIENGKKWLLSQKKDQGWEGEPVLYYWFEEGRDKIFYCCRDKGQITSAWAALALAV